MVFFRKKKFIFFSCVLFLVVAAVPSFAKGEALSAVQAGVEGLLAILKDQTLRQPEKKTERHNTILQYICGQFDFAKMSELVVTGTEWGRQSEAERHRFTDLFSQLLEHAYVGKLENYTDEKVEFIRERMQGERGIVYTTILHQGQAIPLHYTVYAKNGKWLVYDVNIEGVSLVRNYRTQFQPILRNEGFNGLVKKMKEKIAVLAKEERSQ